MADYYVATTGDDSADGSQAAPWATLEKAIATAVGGDSVTVGAGDYPQLAETTAAGRTSMLVFRADGAVRVNTLNLSYPSPQDSYLCFIGFDFHGDAVPAHGVVTLENSARTQFKQCKVHADQWATAGAIQTGFYIKAGSSNFMIERCHVYEVAQGCRLLPGSSNMTVRGNHIQVKAESGIQAAADGDVLIEFNHIAGEDWVRNPPNSDAPVDPHQSMISVRCNNITIRQNVIHGLGTSSCILLYDPDAIGGQLEYRDVNIHNNAIYSADTNQQGVRLRNVAERISLKNNLFFSKLRDSSAGAARFYGTAVTVETFADGYDATNVELANNILIGSLVSPAEINESDNVIWAWFDENNDIRTYSQTSRLVTIDQSLADAERSTYFEDGSFFEETIDFGAIGRNFQSFALAQNSDGINYGGIEAQIPYGLGAIDADGFLSYSGPDRNNIRHSVGPYETGNKTIESSKERNVPPAIIRPRPDIAVTNGESVGFSIGWGMVGGEADPLFNPRYLVAGLPPGSDLTGDAGGYVGGGDWGADITHTISISVENKLGLLVTDEFTVTVGAGS